MRYADDFIVLHTDKQIVESAKTFIKDFLKSMSLEIHESNTRITHTYLSVNAQRPGFKFLGFWIKNYSVGKTERENRNVITIVERLNPIIRG